MNSDGNIGQTEVLWWPEGEKLIFLGEETTANFWDKHWDNNDWRKRITSSRDSRLWSGILRKYLPDKNRRILEGGCGCGHLVDAMNYWGYNAVGVDYAKETVYKIKEISPELDVRFGDVRNLKFEDNYFDGYWSPGVIEHFWDGYEQVLSEMRRVLKPGGCAFVSFPCISFFDRFKILCGGYKRFASHNKPTGFYPFALDSKSVSKHCESLGFKILKKKHLCGLLGLE